MLARFDRTCARLLIRNPIKFQNSRFKSNSSDEGENVDQKSHFYPNTSFGIKERSVKPDEQPIDKPLLTPFPPFPDGKNPKTGEIGGPAGPEPTQYGDWQRKGRVTDF